MKKYMLIIILLVMLSNNLNNFSHVNKNRNLFKDIVSITESNAMEYGLRFTYTGNDINYKDTKKIFEQLKIDCKDASFEELGEEKKVIIKNNDVSYELCFFEVDSKKITTLKIDGLGNESDLEEMKEKSRELFKESKYLKSYSYLKCSIENKNIIFEEKKILNYLESISAKNTESVKIDNGYSIVSNTGSKNSLSKSDPVDLNIALTNYGENNYLIIGTPIIMISY